MATFETVPFLNKMEFLNGQDGEDKQKIVLEEFCYNISRNFACCEYKRIICPATAWRGFRKTVFTDLYRMLRMCIGLSP